MLRNHFEIRKVVVATGRSDMRLGIDGLVSLIRLRFKMDITEPGTLFMFCGRQRDRIKCIFFDGDGIILLNKRLLDGRYQWPRGNGEPKVLTMEQYRRLIEGFPVESTIRSFTEDN